MKLDQELKKSEEYLKSNNLEIVEKIYNNILQKMPDNIEVLMKMGILKIKIKHYEEAIIFFKKILNLSTKSLDAYINISNVYIILNKYDEAIYFLEQANRYSPKKILVIQNLAFLYLNINKLKLASNIVEQGLRLEFENFFLLNIQGSILIKKNQITQGIKIFKKVLNIKINFWPAYDNLFNILEKTNQLVEFNKNLIKGKKIFKNNINLLFYESLYCYRNNNFKFSKKLLLSINIKNTNKNIPFLIKYHDLLAKNYDKLDDYENSYHNYKKRNELKGRLSENIKFDKNVIIKTIDDYSNFYKKEKLKNLVIQQKSDLVTSPFFLIGFPRSGTTLLDSILRSHSDTIVLEEQPFISKIRDDFFLSNQSLISSINKINANDILHLQKKYFKMVSKLENNKNLDGKLIVDKFPLNLMEVGFINKIFPQSKFILALRHPCDVAISCFTADFKINEAMANFLEIEDTIILYDKIFSLWEQYTKELKIQYHEVKYENLIFNFDKYTKELLDFLELDWQKEVKNFQNTAKNRIKINTPSYNQVIKPLYKDSIDRWKKFENIINLYPKLEKWINKFNY